MSERRPWRERSSLRGSHRKIYADARSVTNNTVMEQLESTHDADSNLILIATRQRYHNAAGTQLGALQNPGTTPKARVTYVAQYPDGAANNHGDTAPY